MRSSLYIRAMRSSLKSKRQKTNWCFSREHSQFLSIFKVHNCALIQIPRSHMFSNGAICPTCLLKQKDQSQATRNIKRHIVIPCIIASHKPTRWQDPRYPIHKQKLYSDATHTLWSSRAWGTWHKIHAKTKPWETLQDRVQSRPPLEYRTTLWKVGSTRTCLNSQIILRIRLNLSSPSKPRS